jgi:hypothetical protein
MWWILQNNSMVSMILVEIKIDFSLPTGAVVSGENVLCFYQKREKAHTTAQPVIPLLDSGSQENRKERD